MAFAKFTYTKLMYKFMNKNTRLMKILTYKQPPSANHVFNKL